MRDRDVTVSPFDAGEVHGFLHRPEGRAERGLVLGHGAGSDCRAPLLVAAADAFAAAGVAVLRVDLAFRRARAKGPPHPATAAADRAGLRAAVTALAREIDAPVLLGGHSYGGRQASMLAAEAPEVAPALLLLSYPLHPPNQPEKTRTAHFPRLAVPALFVQGATDPFATEAEMIAALALVPAPAKLIAVAGAGHDLKRGKLDWAPVIAALRGLANMSP